MEDVGRYAKTIEPYKDLVPIERKLVKIGEKIRGVVVFHDASVAAL